MAPRSTIPTSPDAFLTSSKTHGSSAPSGSLASLLDCFLDSLRSGSVARESQGTAGLFPAMPHSSFHSVSARPWLPVAGQPSFSECATIRAGFGSG